VGKLEISEERVEALCPKLSDPNCTIAELDIS